MAFLGDFGRTLKRTTKEAQRFGQDVFDEAGRGLGRLGSGLGSDELGQFLQGSTKGIGGLVTADLSKTKSGFRQGFGGVTALTAELFGPDQPVDESPDVGDPFTQEGRQSARDPRRRGGGTGTILTSNSQTPSLLG